VRSVLVVTTVSNAVIGENLSGTAKDIVRAPALNALAKVRLDVLSRAAKTGSGGMKEWEARRSINPAQLVESRFYLKGGLKTENFAH
jgi:phosphoribosylanthranilate isomerase